MASRYNDLVQKAQQPNSLGFDNNDSIDTRMLRGIGLALLAVAQAIKDGAHEIAEEMAYTRRTRPKV